MADYLNRGSEGLRKGGQMEKDINALKDSEKKKRAEAEKKAAEGLKKAFPEEKPAGKPAVSKTPKTAVEINAKIDDLMELAGQAEEGGNRKAGQTYRKTAAEYRKRLEALEEE